MNVEAVCVRDIDDRWRFFCHSNIFNVRYVYFNSNRFHYVFSFSIVWLVPFCQESSCYFYCIVFRIVSSSQTLAREFFILHSAQCNSSVDVHSIDIPSRRQEWRRGMFEKKMFKRSHYYCLVMSLSSYCVHVCVLHLYCSKAVHLFSFGFSMVYSFLHRCKAVENIVSPTTHEWYLLLGLLRWRSDNPTAKETKMPILSCQLILWCQILWIGEKNIPRWVRCMQISWLNKIRTSHFFFLSPFWGPIIQKKTFFVSSLLIINWNLNSRVCLPS